MGFTGTFLCRLFPFLTMKQKVPLSVHICEEGRWPIQEALSKPPRQGGDGYFCFRIPAQRAWFIADVCRPQEGSAC